jgi:vancomycin resistance protein YoaR
LRLIGNESRTLFLLPFLLSLPLLANWVDNLERDWWGVKEGVVLHDVGVERLYEWEVREVIEEIAMRLERLPVEPCLNRDNGEIIAEKPGVRLNVEKTLTLVMAAPKQTRVRPVVEKIDSRFHSEDLRKANKCWGAYQTWFHGSPQRHRNIEAALDSINNSIVWPGDIFSFNEATGPRTPERGYLPAPVIINGGFDMDYGGGVCQASSTVYNAALQAGLPIIERHAHSKPVHYVPAGRDAAVDYGSLDMKFHNNHSGPIIIKSGIYRGRLTVEIWGGEK